MLSSIDRDLERPRPAARRAVLAMTDVRHAAWIARAIAGNRVGCTWVASLPALYDVLAGGPTALVIEDTFDGAPAESVLATLRTAGAALPAFVLAMWKRPELVRRLPALAPAVLVADPFTVGWLGALVCELRAQTWTWPMRRAG
ncbi:MAG TPA: hypothetical protein VHE35_29545 [Kofleriaceae bacterium]|nr:hypothetical protein [Kofleriaceae bacterium]